MNFLEYISNSITVEATKELIAKDVRPDYHGRPQQKYSLEEFWDFLKKKDKHKKLFIENLNDEAVELIVKHTTEYRWRIPKVLRFITSKYAFTSHMISNLGGLLPATDFIRNKNFNFPKEMKIETLESAMEVGQWLAAHEISPNKTLGSTIVIFNFAFVNELMRASFKYSCSKFKMDRSIYDSIAAVKEAFRIGATTG
jgi:hypothetical protein